MVHHQLVRAYYDAVAPDYEDLYRDRLSLAENSFVARLVAGELDAVTRCRVLDLGCGAGLGASMVDEYARCSGRSCEYVGIDISPRMIEIARSAWSQRPGFRFHEADMSDLTGFGDGEFDLVLSLFGSFSHVGDFGRAMNGIGRVLSENGKIVLMVYSRYSLQNLVRRCLGSREALGIVQQYQIRNSSDGISCPAIFYSSLPLRYLLISNGFTHVRCIGLNAVFELPLVKPLARHAAHSRSMLMFESRLLGAMPDLAHSLIATAQKG